MSSLAIAAASEACEHSLTAERSPADAELVSRARAGDTAAFDALYRRTHGAVVRRISHLAGPGVIQDLVQDAFVAAFQGIHRFRGDAPFEHWMLRIATNVARTHYRKHRRSRLRLWERADAVAEVVSPLRGVDESYPHLQLVHRALDRLSPRLRETVVLYELEGLSLAEIADVLEIPLNTVAAMRVTMMLRMSTIP